MKKSKSFNYFNSYIITTIIIVTIILKILCSERDFTSISHIYRIHIIILKVLILNNVTEINYVVCVCVCIYVCIVCINFQMIK